MIRVYGCSISYFTGKLETYLRYRGHDYERLSLIANAREALEGAGVVQHPVAQLADGRWMSDTTPILAWFEHERGEEGGASIYPGAPDLRFAALLLEDYADEWLWRPAMHYRWSYRADRVFASAAIVDDELPAEGLRRYLRCLSVRRRQRGGFVQGDGVTKQTWDHVEQGYLRALDLMEGILAERPFLFGDRPSIADFGLMGPMLRHFAQDPTPAEIMRNRASRVYEWVGRMWNARDLGPATRWIDGLDAPLVALLVEACETHLAQLRANAVAYQQGLGRMEMEVQGCRYQQVPVSRYRVWCLEQLRGHWQGLDEATRGRLLEVLPGEVETLLGGDDPPARSEYDPEGKAPFNRAINVFGRGVPPR